MHAERQPVTGIADRGQHLRQLIAAVACHVQDGPELLALELIERAQLEHLRREEMTRGGQRRIELAGIKQLRLGAHALGVHREARARRRRDHGTYVG